jgi:hypothetical protein
MNRLRDLTAEDLDWARLRGPRIVAALAAAERDAAVGVRAVISAVIGVAMLVALASGWLDASAVVTLFFVDAAAMLGGDALRWTLAAPGFTRYYAARRDEQRLAEIRRARISGVRYDAAMVTDGRLPLAVVVGMTAVGAAALGWAWATLVAATPALASAERYAGLAWACAALVVLRLGEAAVDVAGHWSGQRPRGFLPRFPVFALGACPAAIVMVAVADDAWGHAAIAGAYYAIMLAVACVVLWSSRAASGGKRHRAETARAELLRQWLSTLDD